MAEAPQDDKQNAPRAKSGKAKGAIRETLSTVLWAGAIAMACRIFFFEPFNIPSGSMLPNLKIGDYLFVSKFSYGYGKYSFPFAPFAFDGRVLGDGPERGDVAVFRKPTDPSIDFIKRIVGLPGDRIQVIDGILHINGEAVERSRVEDYRAERGERLGDRVPQFQETLPNGRSYMILEALGDGWRLDNTPVYEVPEGHYFAMGDNRDHSSDSRVLRSVGYVPVENFIGRASFIFFSWGESGPRFSRLFNGID